MNPQEAKALADQTNTDRDQAFTKFIAIAHQAIQTAAKQGKYSVTNVFSGIRCGITEPQEKQVYAFLQKQGYNVQYKTVNWQVAQP